MDARGWVKLYRQIWSCDVWQAKEPFDRRSAWIDLILLCNHADGDFYDGRTTIHVERGQFVTSIRHLADRWHWSKDKVSRYLRHLSRQKMIHITATPTATVITLVKYEFFQSDRDSYKDSKRDTDNDTSKSQTRKNNNTKNIRKVNEHGERDEYDFHIG